MSRCTGRDRRGAAVLALLMFVGCADGPDARITVRRTEPSKLDVLLCGPTCQAEPAAVFAISDPVSLEKTLGIYLDTPIDQLRVQLQETSPSACHTVVVPFDGDPRELTVILPDLEGTIMVLGCADCIGERVCP